MYLSDSDLGYFALGQLQPPQLTVPPQPRPSLLQPGPQLRLPPYETIVGYARDRSSLTSAQLDRVRRVADFIASTWPGNGAITSVRVTGYIDTDEWLSGLGEQRALAVRAAMLAALNQARPGLSANIRLITEDRGLGSVPKVEIYLWAGPTSPPIPPLVRVPSPAEVAHRAVPMGPGGPTPAPSTSSVQRLPPNPLDARAQAIIAAANAPTPGIYGRAVATVWSILRIYYPSEATKVSWVVFAENVPGLITTRMGTGPAATGGIRVGRYFIEHVSAHSFARRVLQVGHELRHVDQYRAGMIGHDRQPEREFLGHCWAVFAGERPGTGRMSHSMRVAIIDAALGNLNCLTAQVRARYQKHEERLRAMRATEQTASGNAATLPPTTCVRSP
ncbi:MAG TPA: hypothetical protein VGN86_12915 [Pyrinomonadaceae bacterium]|jgi:hypothetical protein|nr:hypothetical protein [Pyrinomonadaceae bacterium]